MTTALGMALMVLLAFAGFGACVSYRDAQQQDGERRDGQDRADGEVAASAWDPGEQLASSRYLDAWDAMGGRGVRMQLLAIASDELAQRCRQSALAGQPPPGVLAAEDYCYGLPDELRDRAGRPGEPAAWQAMDRALARLSAIVDDADAAAHADAHEQVSIAARALAAELDELGVTADLDHCWFCGRGHDAVERLLQSRHAAICGDCVQACHARLYEL